MKYIYLPLVLLFTLLMVSCADEDGEQTITIDNKYSLTIPAFLSEVDNLNDDASLQYQNVMKGLYVVVIDEPKDELHQVLVDYNLTDRYESNLDGYANLILDGLNESLTDPKQTEVIETNVNGLPVKLTTMVGTIENIRIFYTYGIYEGKDTYYQVIVWTGSDMQSKYQSKMEAVLQTLKELNTNRKKGVILNQDEK